MVELADKDYTQSNELAKPIYNESFEDMGISVNHQSFIGMDY